MNKKGLMDDYEPLTRGFCAALRNKEYFLFLKDVFTFMNKVQMDIDPGPQSETYFLDKIYKTKTIGKNWQKIVTLYERNYAPIKYVPNKIDEATSKLLSESDGVIADAKTREQHEYEALMTRIDVLYPPPDGADEDIKRLAKYFLSRPANEVDADFKICVAALEITCLRLGSFQNLKDIELHEKDPRKALDKKEDRLKKIRALFSRASASFVCSSSATLKEILIQKDRTRRIPFLAGEGWSSLDGQIGGFHATGLICFIGGTSGFKTGAMSSIAANHCLDAFMAGREPPAIWGYIGEDGVEAYTRRIMTNIMNRKPIIDSLEFGAFNIGQFNDLMSENMAFQTAVFGLIDLMLPNCHWIKPPENPTEKLNFSAVNILEAFDAKLESGAVKPKFIIMDYLNLLSLPRNLGVSNRAQEISLIAHMLDEWAQQKGIPIITSVQASVGGAVGARDMRFFNQEDIHECKSVQHHCRMMISLLPFTDYTDEPTSRWLGVHILKNRDGEKDKTFITSLDEGANITFVDSKYFSEADWARHKENVINKKNEAFGTELEGKDGGGKNFAGKKGPFIKKPRRDSGGGPAVASTPEENTPSEHGEI